VPAPEVTLSLATPSVLPKTVVLHSNTPGAPQVFCALACIIHAKANVKNIESLVKVFIKLIWFWFELYKVKRL
jgi:hypothetical protein